MAGLRRKKGGKAGFENPYCGPSVWYNNICLTQWLPSTPTQYICFVTAMSQSASAMTLFNWYVCDHNGSLCIMANEYNDAFHLMGRFYLTMRNRYFWLSKMTCFTSFVPSTTRLIWLSSFIFKICASSNMIEYAFGHQASQKLQEWWILPWAFDVRTI